MAVTIVAYLYLSMGHTHISTRNYLISDVILAIVSEDDAILP
jgi:hypothetical protein